MHGQSEGPFYQRLSEVSYSNFRGVFQPCWCEVDRIGLTAGSAKDDDPSPLFERVEAMADITLVTAQGFDQCIMTTRGASVGAAMFDHSPPEDAFLQSGYPPSRHRFLPPTPL
jgi:hypothetical protein